MASFYNRGANGVSGAKGAGMFTMVPKFFGQYLLEKEILDKDQLIEAINYQNPRF